MESFAPTKFVELQGYLDSLAPRDRLALKVLTGFLAGCLLVFVIALPAKHFHSRAADRFTQERQLLRWLQAQRPLIETSPATAIEPAPDRDLSPLTQITVSAKKHDLSVKRIQPDGEKQLRVWMEQVPFDKTIVWLEAIVQRRGVSLNEVTIERQANLPGVVNVRASIGFY